jgi:hypothetical protein
MLANIDLSTASQAAQKQKKDKFKIGIQKAKLKKRQSSS